MGVDLPALLVVEAVNRVDRRAFAPEQVGVPVVDDAVNPAFRPPAVEVLVKSAEHCLAGVDYFVVRDVAVARTARRQVLRIVLTGVYTGVSCESVLERLDGGFGEPATSPLGVEEVLERVDGRLVSGPPVVAVGGALGVEIVGPELGEVSVVVLAERVDELSEVVVAEPAVGRALGLGSRPASRMAGTTTAK